MGQFGARISQARILKRIDASVRPFEKLILEAAGIFMDCFDSSDSFTRLLHILNGKNSHEKSGQSLLCPWKMVVMAALYV